MISYCSVVVLIHSVINFTKFVDVCFTHIVLRWKWFATCKKWRIWRSVYRLGGKCALPKDSVLLNPVRIVVRKTFAQTASCQYRSTIGVEFHNNPHTPMQICTCQIWGTFITALKRKNIFSHFACWTCSSVFWNKYLYIRSRLQKFLG